MLLVHNNKIVKTISLYINYLVHGMAIVILAQNMSALSEQWHVNDAGVSFVISSLGIGRLLVLYISGILSDRYGRKIFIQLGILTYIPFFIGIVLSPNIYVAYVCGVLAGAANSFLDSGTYPALMELYPNDATTANVLIKAFASVGELLLPILVTVIEFYKIWFGWSFVLCTAIFALNFLLISRQKFPKGSGKLQDKAGKSQKIRLTFREKINAVALTIYGYVSMSTFYLVSQWLTKYGEMTFHMTLANARYLVSIYSIGSIVGVVLMTLLSRLHIRPTVLMLSNTSISLVTLIAMTTIFRPIVLFVGSFTIGFSAAGGVMQVGLTVMSKLFPKKKGLITGIYYTAGSLSSFSIPIITGYLYHFSVWYIMLLDCFIAFLGVLISTIVVFNTKKLI